MDKIQKNLKEDVTVVKKISLSNKNQQNFKIILSVNNK